MPQAYSVRCNVLEIADNSQNTIAKFSTIKIEFMDRMDSISFFVRVI